MSPDAYPADFRVEHDKLTDYLLNEAHPVGKSKAKFFLAFGFTTADPARLAIELAKQAFANGPGTDSVSANGIPTLLVDGPILTPDGRNPKIRTVWTLGPNDEANFVTAFPRR